MIDMTWKDIIKKNINTRFTVKTTPPLQGYSSPSANSQKDAFYHLKEFIVSTPMGELQLRGTEFGEKRANAMNNIPMKGNITSLDGKQVAEFEIVPL